MAKRWFFACYVGLYGGLIWGALRWLFYVLKFSKVLPGFLIEPWFRKSFMHSWQGHLTGLGAFVLLSVAAALLYAALLWKAKGPWPGIAFGAAWYVLLMLGIAPAWGMIPRWKELWPDSASSELCLFLLWGVFIGYSIALEFTDERPREPMIT